MVLVMSEKRTTITIPPELDAEMTPAVRAFVEVLLARIESLETEGDVPLIVRTGDCLLGNYVTVDSPERQTLIDRDGAGVQAVGRNGGDVAVGDSAIPSSTFAGRSNACTR